MNRRCSITVFDGTIERVILVDTHFSPTISQAHDLLADHAVPHRVNYSDKYTGRIMFDSFPTLT